jgi:hypothetical protein
MYTFFYVLKQPTGEMISAEEEILRHKDDGYIMATLVPEGGHMVPFTSFRDAYNHILDREHQRFGADDLPELSVVPGMTHGQYVNAIHEQHPFRTLQSTPYITKYLVLQVEENK